MPLKNLYQKFTQRLTRWLKRSQLESCIEPFRQYYGECEGVEYIIKSNRKKIRPRFAVFIKKGNLLRRETDRNILGKIDLVDLVLLARPLKEEEIPILTTIAKRW